MKFPEQFRFNSGFMPETKPGDPCGMFIIPASTSGGRPLKVIAADGDIEPVTEGWEHVSVSIYGAGSRMQCPTWNEMCAVKNLFWEPDACVVQLHPPQEDAINVHNGCLHLWRSTRATFPMPPKILV